MVIENWGEKTWAAAAPQSSQDIAQGKLSSLFFMEEFGREGNVTLLKYSTTFK